MNTPLQKAAQAMIARWDSPTWKDQPHTAEYIAELRKALNAELQQAVEPVAWAVYSGILDMRKHSVWNKRGDAEEAASTIKSYTETRPLYLHPPQPQATTPVSTCGLDTDTLRDMAGAAFEEAMAFGVSTDSFERLARHVNKAATKAAKGEKP